MVFAMLFAVALPYYANPQKTNKKPIKKPISQK